MIALLLIALFGVAGLVVLGAVTSEMNTPVVSYQPPPARPQRQTYCMPSRAALMRRRAVPSADELTQMQAAPPARQPEVQPVQIAVGVQVVAKKAKRQKKAAPLTVRDMEWIVAEPQGIEVKRP